MRNPSGSGHPRDKIIARLTASAAEALTKALERAQKALERGSGEAQLADQLDSLAAALKPDNGSAVSSKRLAALRDTVQGIASRLR